MFASPKDESTLKTVESYALAVTVGIIAYILVNIFTGGTLPLVEFGIAFAITVFIWRLSRR
ncbi:MAG TPA: hypothetical protein VK918_08065 [Pyrinomonadaceae bacterium]|nr:hypothetical protein [Pyrinomonadaceae bacterium]